VSFEVPVTVKIQVMLYVVTLCSVVVGYQHFGGPYCLHLHTKDDGGSTAHHHNPEEFNMNIVSYLQ